MFANKIATAINMCESKSGKLQNLTHVGRLFVVLKVVLW